MLGAINSINNIWDTNFLRNFEIDAANRPATSSTDKATPQTNSPSIENDDSYTPAQVEDPGQRRVESNEKPVAEEQQSQEDQKTKNDKSDRPGAKNETELSDAEKKEVQQLKETDRKVRAHEMAHLAAAAGIAMSGANFEYKQGPDGVNYAVGGDVKIDVSKEKDPEATIEKAQKIAAAALAPADPSPQDRKVAAKARAMEAEARAELIKEQQQETQAGQENKNGTPVGSDQATEKTNTQNNRTDNQTHPGIESYRQNQAFAPGSSINNTTNNTSPFDLANANNHTTANRYGFFTTPAGGSRLDMVA